MAGRAIHEVDAGEGDVERIGGEAFDGSHASGFHRVRGARARGELTQQLHVPPRHYARGEIDEGAQQALARVSGYRARGNAEVGLDHLAIALDRQSDRRGNETFAATLRQVGSLAQPAPQGPPCGRRARTEGRRGIPVEERPARIVVEVDALLAPPQAHRLARREHQAHGETQRLGPCCRGAERRRSPIHGSNGFAHAASRRGSIPGRGLEGMGSNTGHDGSVGN